MGALQPKEDVADEPRVTQAVFEGLFTHALHPDAEFLAELKSAGFDLSHQQVTYPARIWGEALDIAARRTYPGMDKAEAMRKLGAIFIDGFFKTITGRLIAVTLPLMGPDGLMKRFPRFWGTGSLTAKMETVREGPEHWTLLMADRAPHPDFDCGIFVRALQRAGAKEVVAQVTESRNDGFKVDLRW